MLSSLELRNFMLFHRYCMQHLWFIARIISKFKNQLELQLQAFTAGDIAP